MRGAVDFSDYAEMHYGFGIHPEGFGGQGGGEDERVPLAVERVGDRGHDAPSVRSSR